MDKITDKNNKVERYYEEIAAGLESLTTHTQGQGANYCGTSKHYLGVPTPEKKKFIKKWWSEHKEEISFNEWLDLISKLAKSNIHEFISAASNLLEVADGFRKQLDPHFLDQWLDNVEGWAEVDTFSQSKFGADEILGRWAIWNNLLQKLSDSENPHKKRASLVLLTRPVREVKDEKLQKTAFLLIGKHKSLKNPLITKAISWLLREMIKNYREAVEDYLKKNIDYLPKIAVRETKRKLLTGKK